MAVSRTDEDIAVRDILDGAVIASVLSFATRWTRVTRHLPVNFPDSRAGLTSRDLNVVLDVRTHALETGKDL